MKKYLLSIVLSGLLFAGLLGQNVGDPAPDFSFSDYNGNLFSLSDHQGKVVFLFTFGNTCPSCLAFGNQTQTRIQEVYGDREDFVAVGADFWNSSSTSASVSLFAQQTGITYPLLVKAGAMAEDYSTTYDSLLVIDREGILRHKGNSVASNDINNAIAVIDEYLMPATLGVQQNVLMKINTYPNPVNDRLSLEFQLEQGAHVDIHLYNSLGQKESIDYNGWLPAGRNQVILNTSTLENGLYFYSFSAEGMDRIAGRIMVKR